MIGGQIGLETAASALLRFEAAVGYCAAMAAKIKELGLTNGPLYFIELREMVADHAHLVMKGPMLGEAWVAELDAQRAAPQKK